jgi:DNA segregation ATPase FtsK/SpoIIIE, S-DNA-T family
MTPERSGRRRELISILALTVGAFVGLSLLPMSVTGPVGRGVGAILWEYFGVGAALIPVMAVLLGAVGFGWVQSIDQTKASILGAGLVLLVPYGIGVVMGLRTPLDLPPNHTDWSPWQQLVGVVPALLVIGLRGVIGAGGAALAGVFGLSVLTLYTVGWHPFRDLAGWLGRSFRARGLSGEVEVLEVAPTGVILPTPTTRLSGRAQRSTASRGADADEQAFITDETIPPFPLDLLDKPSRETVAEDEAELDRLGGVLVDTLKTFRVDADLGPQRSTGPVVTQFEVAPAPGVKVGRIAALADDLALKMEAKSIRIVAPIPGRPYVGVEVPNPTARIVTLRELLSPPGWNGRRGGLPIALGRDLEGKPVIADLSKMPHLLIAGATGSGKSVCINTIITGLVHRYTERELQLLMIDPKMVELTAYNALPHLIHEVVTSNKDAAKALKWAMIQMEERYELFSVNNVRNLHEFNRKVKEGKDVVMPARAEDVEGMEEVQERGKRPVVPYTGSTRPYVVVIVDELADLMMTVQGEVEKPLAILAQKARATGIHLILATQRPSVNVITGLIKANFPSRIAFRVASKVDSRTILDQNGAEALLGNGDMLFLPPGHSEPVRVQGAFISTQETERVTDWYRTERAKRAAGTRRPAMDTEDEQLDILQVVREWEAREERAAEPGTGIGSGDWDPLFREAAETCIQNQLGSTSLLQRKLRIGYGRAARIIDQLHDAGILGPPDGSKAREVLIGSEQLDEYCGR